MDYGCVFTNSIVPVIFDIVGLGKEKWKEYIKYFGSKHEEGIRESKS